MRHTEERQKVVLGGGFAFSKEEKGSTSKQRTGEKELSKGGWFI